MITNSTPTLGSPSYADRQRTVVWLWVCCVVAAGFHLYLTVQALAPLRDVGVTGPVFPDFMVFYAAGPAMRAKGLPLVFDARAFTAFQSVLFRFTLDAPIRFERPWLYPPTYLLLAAPLSLLPFVTSAVLAQAGGLIALWFAMGRRTLATLAICTSSAFCLTFVAGQNAALSAACVIGGVSLLDRAPVFAGVLLALLTLKPQLFVLVPIALIAARAWRALAACAATASALVGISLVAFGVDGWRLWIQAATGPSSVLTSAMTTSYGMQMGSVFASVRMMGGVPAFAWGVQLAAMVLAAWMTVKVFARRDHSSDAYCIARRAIVLSSATLLASPYWMNYDLLVPCAAVALTVAQRLSRGGAKTLRSGEALSWTTLWLLPLPMLMINTVGAPVAPVLIAGALVIASRYGEVVGTSEALLNREVISVWRSASVN